MKTCFKTKNKQSLKECISHVAFHVRVLDLELLTLRYEGILDVLVHLQKQRFLGIL